MKENKALSIAELLVYIAMGIVLLILPFPRGSFFEKEILPLEFTIYILFTIWGILKVIKKEKIEFNTWLSIPVLILPIAYLLPVIFGYSANFTDALSYFMKYVAYLAVFLMASDIKFYEKKHGKFTLIGENEELPDKAPKKRLLIILSAVALAGIVAAVLGIDSLVGGSIGKALGFSNIGYTYNRLYGVMQYANTMGMYFGMVFFVIVAIAFICEKRYIKCICSSFMFLVLIGLMLTVSRGAMVLMPVIYILLLIFLPKKEEKIELILLTVMSIFVAFVIYILMQRFLTESNGIVWVLILAGMAISAIGAMLLLMNGKVFEKISNKTYFVIIIAFVIALTVSVIVIFATGLYTKIIPQSILDRFLGSSGDVTSGRTDFYRDGFKVLKNTWLLGAGGGAWNALYRTYQSYLYGSSEAHNLFLQVWIETGIIGVISYVFVIISAIKVYIDCKEDKEKQTMATLVLAVVLYVMAHAMIDFDFSYFSVPVTVFTMLGILNSLGSFKKEKCKFRLSGIFTSLVSTGLGILLFCFILARGYAADATEIIINAGKNLTVEQLLEANEKLQKAVELNPWDIKFYWLENVIDADLQVDLCTIYDMAESIEGVGESALQLHYTVLNKALELNPKNPILNATYAQFLLNKAGDYEEGLKYMELGLKYNPMSPNRYEEIANSYYEVGAYLVNNGDLERGKEMLQRVLKVEDDIAEVNKRALKEVVITEKTKEYVNSAKEILFQ